MVAKEAPAQTAEMRDGEVTGGPALPESEASIEETKKDGSDAPKEEDPAVGKGRRENVWAGAGAEKGGWGRERTGADNMI